MKYAVLTRTLYIVDPEHLAASAEPPGNGFSKAERYGTHGEFLGLTAFFYGLFGRLIHRPSTIKADYLYLKHIRKDFRLI